MYSHYMNVRAGDYRLIFGTGILLIVESSELLILPYFHFTAKHEERPVDFLVPYADQKFYPDVVPFLYS